MPLPKTSPEEFKQILRSKETKVLEFKRETKTGINEIAENAVAFYNTRRGTGRLVIGVSDSKRKVVGTSLFKDTAGLERQVYSKVKVTIDVEPYPHEDGRVLIIHVPESSGIQIASFDGRYLIRRGSSTVDMTPDEIAQRLTVSHTSVRGGKHPDYTAQITDQTIADLDQPLLDAYLAACSKKTSSRIGEAERFLHNTGLFVEGHATIAALILLGDRFAIRDWVGVSKTVFFYTPNRKTKAKEMDRRDYEGGMWGCVDQIWAEIDLRNPDQFYQHEFSRHGVPTFDRATIREAIMNAIMHRDYTKNSSIQVEQYEHSIEISSPGGFIGDVSPYNIRNNSERRNELLTYAMHLGEQVEQLGTGVTMMYDQAMAMGKPLPDYSTSDSARVRLILEGRLVHTELAQHIRHTGSLAAYDLTPEEYQVLCSVALEEPVDDRLKDVRTNLIKTGIIKTSGRGRATQYSLALDSYRPPQLFNEDQELVENILDMALQAGQDGITMRKLVDGLDGLSDKQIRRVVNNMKRDGLLNMDGRTKSARWCVTTKGSDLRRVTKII